MKRRRAEIRDLEVESSQILHRLIDAAADELGTLREIHFAFDAAQLDRGIPKPRRLLENARPAPFRAAERREADGKLRRALPGADNGRRCGGRGESGKKTPA